MDKLKLKISIDLKNIIIYLVWGMYLYLQSHQNRDHESLKFMSIFKDQTAYLSAQTEIWLSVFAWFPYRFILYLIFRDKIISQVHGEKCLPWKHEALHACLPIVFGCRNKVWRLTWK